MSVPGSVFTVPWLNLLFSGFITSSEMFSSVSSSIPCQYMCTSRKSADLGQCHRLRLLDRVWQVRILGLKDLGLNELGLGDLRVKGVRVQGFRLRKS